MAVTAPGSQSVDLEILRRAIEKMLVRNVKVKEIAAAVRQCVLGFAAQGTEPASLMAKLDAITGDSQAMSHVAMQNILTAIEPTVAENPDLLRKIISDINRMMHDLMTDSARVSWQEDEDCLHIKIADPPEITIPYSDRLREMAEHEDNEALLGELGVSGKSFAGRALLERYHAVLTHPGLSYFSRREAAQQEKAELLNLIWRYQRAIVGEIMFHTYRVINSSERLVRQDREDAEILRLKPIADMLRIDIERLLKLVDGLLATRSTVTALDDAAGWPTSVRQELWKMRQYIAKKSREFVSYFNVTIAPRRDFCEGYLFDEIEGKPVCGHLFDGYSALNQKLALVMGSLQALDRSRGNEEEIQNQKKLLRALVKHTLTDARASLSKLYEVDKDQFLREGIRIFSEILQNLKQMSGGGGRYISDFMKTITSLQSRIKLKMPNLAQAVNYAEVVQKNGNQYVYFQDDSDSFDYENIDGGSLGEKILDLFTATQHRQTTTKNAVVSTLNVQLITKFISETKARLSQITREIPAAGSQDLAGLFKEAKSLVETGFRIADKGGRTLEANKLLPGVLNDSFPPLLSAWKTRFDTILTESETRVLGSSSDEARWPEEYREIRSQVNQIKVVKFLVDGQVTRTKLMEKLKNIDLSGTEEKAAQMEKLSGRLDSIHRNVKQASVLLSAEIRPGVDGKEEEIQKMIETCRAGEAELGPIIGKPQFDGERDRFLTEIRQTIAELAAQLVTYRQKVTAANRVIPAGERAWGVASDRYGWDAFAAAAAEVSAAHRQGEDPDALRKRISDLEAAEEELEKLKSLKGDPGNLKKELIGTVVETARRELGVDPDIAAKVYFQLKLDFHDKCIFNLDTQLTACYAEELKKTKKRLASAKAREEAWRRTKEDLSHLVKECVSADKERVDRLVSEFASRLIDCIAGGKVVESCGESARNLFLEMFEQTQFPFRK